MANILIILGLGVRARSVLWLAHEGIEEVEKLLGSLIADVVFNTLCVLRSHGELQVQVDGVDVCAPRLVQA
jgi:hypothetical protein